MICPAPRFFFQLMTEPIRCWPTNDPLYAAYHDEEWGRPVRDERGLYERLCLEGFQAGLAWITILRKREAFRSAFAGFEPDRVARYGDRDVERLLGDAGIVRHRGKIEAAIANARATLELRKADAPLPELVWEYRRDGGIARAFASATAGRVPLRRSDHGLLDAAGVRHRQRPPRRLLGAGRRRGRPGVVYLAWASLSALDKAALSYASYPALPSSDKAATFVVWIPGRTRTPRTLALRRPRWWV